MTDPAFHALFERWARRVRTRLALRRMLAGAAIGLAVALIPAAIGWKMRWADLRLWAPVLGLAGLGLGWLMARRRRWTDTDVALFLDARLETEEAIATAVAGEADHPGAWAVVITTATTALAKETGQRANPRLWKPVHALGAVGAIGLAVIARQPLPAAPAAVAAPGTTKVQTTEVEGLEKAAKLGQLSPRDEAQRERLEKIAKDAEALKEELRKGMEKREAQDKIARLREQLSQERLSLGEGEQRAGLESAVSKLQESEATKKAAKALGDHDLLTVDREMEKLANEREKQDRELAKKKLEEAADAAKKNGAGDVGKALEEEKKLMDRRGERADTLRELADAMKGAGEASDELKTQSEALDRQGSDKAAKQLAESLGKALEKMTPEERKRLAEKLREMAKQSGVPQADADRMKDMAKDLGTPEGQKELEEKLKELAKENTESSESKRQQALDDAERGAQGTERGLGEQGQGQQGQGQQGQGQQGQGQQQQGQGQQGQGQQGQQGQGQGQQAGAVPIPGDGQTAGSGSGTGGGGGPKKGNSGGAGDAQTMKSRARGTISKGQAMPGTVNTFVPGKAGGTANTRGTGDLRIVGPSEVDGVERSDVPEEYREHVRQYFQP
ncbi:hypothetical protein LZC95_24990 [Pendulispora brunnea]|uniref:Uncharacterized protein n=1 Tax=Pendulispora brunnea TaxID=2905690 RepID=A0ABZ2KSU8_9BACT